MCGIAGVIGVDIDPSVVADMVKLLAHRGPDSEGVFQASHATVGVRRLSIIDLDHGKQPITSPDGSLTIVFNGEIYNYRELREELVGRGHRFRSSTDTEVVLHLYQEYGPSCVERLRGMFAFAIVSARSVFLARDRFGIKPLYLARHPEKDLLLFASEIKSLLQCRALAVSPNLEALADRYVLGHITGVQTPFREISSLPSGTYMTVEQTHSGLRMSEHRYFRPQVAEESDIGMPEAIRLVKTALEQAVARHMHADVPVGITLSGGLDSALLAVLASRMGSTPARTFTVSCSPDSNDLSAAREVALAIGSNHQEATPAFEEYLKTIPAYIHTGESVVSLHGLPFFLLCRQVSRSVKVCLNGEGADEIFGGYFNYILPRPVRADLRERLKRAAKAGLPVSSRLQDITGAILDAESFPDYVRVLLSLYQQDQLEHNHLTLLDHYGMAFGVEIRVPFLDDDLAAVANALPPSLKVNRAMGVGKYALRRVALALGIEALHNPVLRVKDGLPSAGLKYHARFENMCDAALPDEYAERHDFKQFFCERDSQGRIKGKADLLLFDLFREIFITHRAQISSVPSFNDFIGRYSNSVPVSAVRSYSAR